MKLAQAVKIVGEIQGKSYSYARVWGFWRIKEAVRTIRKRQAATADDRRLAEMITKVFNEKGKYL